MCSVVCQEEYFNCCLKHVNEDLDDGKYKVNHLERSPPLQNDFWRNPVSDDIQTNVSM